MRNTIDGCAISMLMDEKYAGPCANPDHRPDQRVDTVFHVKG